MEIKLIAHRGNIGGPCPCIENMIEDVESLAQRGVDVEMDVWGSDGDLYAGHEETSTSHIVGHLDFIKEYGERIWFHAKNMEAIQILSATGAHWFAHDRDICALTSKGFLWTGKEVLKNEKGAWKLYALCTDWAG